MRIAIVDDESAAVERLKQFAARYEKESGEVCETDVFSDGNSFIEGYQTVYDVVFLDIEMPYMNGMEAAKELRTIDKDVCIVFVTNMAKYAVKGYSVDAMGYMVKPVTYFQFLAQIKKVRRYVTLRQGKKILLTSSLGATALSTDEILCIESANHKLIYHLIDGEVEVYGTMAEVAEQIKDCNFYCCHRSYFVNLKYVRNITQEKCDLLRGGNIFTVPVSRLKYKEFLKVFSNYICVRRV